MYKLTIAIPTLPVRIATFSALITELNRQIIQGGFQGQVQIISFMDCKDMLVGDKRNFIKSQALGMYLCHIDDDDKITIQGKFGPGTASRSIDRGDARLRKLEHSFRRPVCQFDVSPLLVYCPFRPGVLFDVSTGTESLF